MTEEQAQAEEERMAADLEAKQEEMQIKQAKRQKAMNITSAIINTATGVTKTLAEWGWPLGAIFAAIVGAMGAAQIAMIASTPITTGAEEGGQVIERMQDGKNSTPVILRINEASSHRRRYWYRKTERSMSFQRPQWITPR